MVRRNKSLFLRINIIPDTIKKLTVNMKSFQILITLFSILPQLGYAQPLEIEHTESHYVPAVQGTKLAVDVHFPKNYQNQKLPALLEFTRYWRGAENPETGEPLPSRSSRDRFFLENDYILLKIDVRGTGASYGRRPGEYTPIEVEDARYVVDWVVKQDWSDGQIGAYGTSYSGTTAELLCATGHPAVKAVIPGWSDFDVYQSPSRPYGMLATGFISKWSDHVHLLDQNSSEILNAAVRRVTENVPQEAIAEHRNNPVVLEGARKARFQDSKFGDYTYLECSPISWKKEISASQVPMLVLTSWLDAGTAEGTLLRLEHFSNPQKVVLMPTAHGGHSHASPFVVGNQPVDPVPSVQEQFKLQLDFFDYHLKSRQNDYEKQPNVTYYNLGEESFRTTEVWPPKGQTRDQYYLGSNGLLTKDMPTEDQGHDQYTVDFAVSTGVNNRWSTQMGNHFLNLDHRNDTDSQMLTYTSNPLKEDLQISGTPIITLQLSSTHKEGAIFVYLEHIDENGRSRYITEGGLLLEHRKRSTNPIIGDYPLHSFKTTDAAPMPVDKIEEITFKLWPTSVLIKKGQAIRVAIAGADQDTFDRVPAEGTPTYSIFRNKNYRSFIDLPVIE